jgi:hypothetical protein
MDGGPGTARHSPLERIRRAFVLTAIVAIVVVPGLVALAMLLTGHAG